LRRKAGGYAHAKQFKRLKKVVKCRRRSKSEPPCRPNIEPGVEADFELVGCG